MSSNEEQSSKAPEPMNITVEGILIIFNEKHPLKANGPISVTEEGMIN